MLHADILLQPPAQSAIFFIARAEHRSSHEGDDPLWLARGWARLLVVGFDIRQAKQCSCCVQAR